MLSLVKEKCFVISDHSAGLFGQFSGGIIISFIIPLFTKPYIVIYHLQPEQFNEIIINLATDISFMLKILDTAHQDRQKSDYIKTLGADSVITIGNGRNDILMLRESSLGIGVIQDEGACSQIVYSTHIICKNITDALLLLNNPDRLIVTLRN